MKTAWQYIRISDEDQSNFSLDGQDMINRRYTDKHQITMTQTFVDDGYSAKDFNRPNWKKLEKALASNRNRPDYLIIFKYDRLIRNTREGLSFIERLEEKWGVTLVSSMEDYFVNPQDPYFIKMRTERLVDAEFERRRIADRTKMGIWSARSTGRFLGPAPIGYLNARDEKDKPIILIDYSKKDYIIQIFNDYIDGLTFPMILKRLREKNIHIKGHDGLDRILTNYVYAGLIESPAYKDEKYKIVPGIHEAIISEEVFYTAYYKLQDSKKPQGPKIIDPNLPLRAFIRCRQCGMPHTGGRSKGRSAYYFYYNCNKCKGECYNINKAHQELSDILKQLSIKETVVEALQKEALVNFEKLSADKKTELVRVTKECEELQKKINSLEQKFIEDRIDHLTYRKWSEEYKKAMFGKQQELKALKGNDEDVKNHFKLHLPYLTDINWLYEKADIGHKHTLLKSIFLGGLSKEKIGYRTAFLNPFFSLNCPDIKGLEISNKTEKSAELADFSLSTPDGT